MVEDLRPVRIKVFLHNQQLSTSATGNPLERSSTAEVSTDSTIDCDVKL